MRNNYNFIRIFILTSISIGIILLSSEKVFSQNIKFDLSYGLYKTKLKFHHTSDVDYDDIRVADGKSFTFGVISRIKGNLFLKTEIGLLSTNSFFSILYKYDEGLGEKSKVLVTWLHNKRIFLSILPEYRKSFNKLDYFFNGGISIGSDIKNYLTTSDKTLPKTKAMLGLELNTGLNWNIGAVGIKFDVGFKTFSKSILINKYHPYISYTNFAASIGLVYSL